MITGFPAYSLLIAGLFQPGFLENWKVLKIYWNFATLS
jgi:hypothetical protein